jgi:hypothetical protein
MRANIDEALEICLSKIKKGKNLKECIKDFPEFKIELEELISVVLKIEKQPMINPEKAFLARARNNVLKAHVKKRQKLSEKKSIFMLPKLSTARKALAIALVFILILTGTAFASSNALPGDGLYPIKRGLERAQLAITFGPNDKAELEAKFALKRIDEAGEIEESDPELSQKMLLQAIESLNKVLQKAPNENVETVIGNVILKLENKRIEIINKRLEQEAENNQNKPEDVGQGKPDTPPGQVEGSEAPGQQKEKEKNNNGNGNDK